MNRTYKVIWSKARHCYVVVSELTKSQHKSSSKSELISANVHREGDFGKAAVAAIVAGLLTFGGVAYSPVLAADKDIVKGDSAEIKYDISPTNDGTNIAVGKNAKVFIGGGTQESMLSFGEKADPTMWHGLVQTGWNIHSNEHAKKNLPEAIAIGTNSYARTGSIEIGAHTLAENQIAIGDTTADKLRQFGVASTTLGTNSYTGGGFATTIGSYNVQTNQYEAAGLSDAGNATKNAFATVIGTFNSNESMTGSSSSGVANMISGTANKVTNSNGAIVMGAGNSVKDSIASFDTSAYSSLFKSATDMQKALMDGVAKSAGGATLVIGGANSAEKTQNSQIMGVGNSMKSTTYKKVQYNYLDGFNSSITDASHVKVLGQSVTINKGADSNTVIGDYRTVAEGQTHNVIIGNADEKTPITTEKKDTVILGHNANATIDGGVALGSGSIANVGAGQKGYYVKHDQRSEEGEGYPFQNNEKYKPQSAWISRAGAVSVGDTTNEDQSKWVTRQITGVAAGTKDTDAVNVAQLKNSQTRFYSIYDPGDNWLGIFPQIPNWEKYKNENNQGAQGYWSMAAGFGTSTGGIASTVIGSLSKIDNKWTDGEPYGFQGATAVSVGTLNFNLSDQVTDNEVNSDDPRVIFQSKEESGVANSIVGQGNLTKNSNGALIYGAGNIVTDSYRRVVANGDKDFESLTNQDMESLLSNPEKAIKTLGKIVDISGGKVMAIGGGNVVDKAYDSQVMGVGNTVVGDAIHFEYKESPEVSNLPEGTFDEQVIKEASRDADVWTQYMGSIRKQGTLLNLVDGYYSTLKNGQNDYLIGTANEVTGDPSKNKSNIVFGDYHKLNNGNNNIIIGSADGAVVEKAKGYYEDSESGITTSQEITGQKQHTENLEDAVMIGHNADVQKNGGVAIGAGSVASVDKNAIGYDPATKKASTDTSPTWKSTAAAVSVGDASKKITRQITNVAAGAQDTDAVNVAQLKAAQTHFYSVNSTDEKAGNYNNDGAKGKNSLAAGVGALANGSNSVAIGTNAKAQNDALAVGENASAGNTGIAIGMNANAGYGQNMALGYYAKVENGVQNSTALGYGSQVTKRDILKSDGKDGVISVGKSVGQSGEKGMTRRIINVKAGVNDTDAVNVAQLKAVMNLPVQIYNGGKVASGVYTGGAQIAKDMTISNLQFDFGDGLKAQEVGSDNDKRVLVTLDKDALKDDPDFKGPKGDKGDKGDTGAQGEQGPKGEKGDTGAQGEQGPKGEKGDTGAQGEQGPKGDKGDTGAQGEQGPKGEKGDTGAHGEQGPKGDKGDKGDKGAQGEQGPKGEKGDTGAQGEQGPKGDKGDKGDTGAPGKDGKDGKDGGVGTVVGDDTNITVANTETDATKPANYKVSLNKAITVDKVTAGDTTISSKGVSIAGGPSMTKDGIDAADKKITNVAAGTATTDAVNYGQLKDVESKVDSNTQNIYHMDNRISNLDNRVNKVGAGAAALAALHPLDFDPDDKWDFAVGYGNYRNANSVAFGAFYRPNEDTMFSLGTNFGNGENMFNAGLSFKIGQGGSGITTSKTAMAKKIESLENTVDQQDKKIAELEALVKEQGEMIRQYVGKK